MDALQTYRTEHGTEFPGIVTPDGKVRFLARVPGDAGLQFPRLADNIPLIDRKDWRPFSRHRKIVPILDQGQYGSCNGHAWVTALMRARAAANFEFQLLSACFLYALINGGRDAGSNIGEGATALKTTGTCLESQGPEGKILKRQYTAAQWQDGLATAARFKLAEVYSFTTFDEAVTAALLGFHLNLSVLVAGSWNNLDKDGRVPAYRGVGNHAVGGGDGLFFASNGEPLLDMTNSWGLRWGMDGRFRIGEATISHQPYFEGCAIKAVAHDPKDPTLPIAAA